MRWTEQFFKKYRWALLSGILMGTSYIPFPPWAIIFCWVPLWWDLTQNTTSVRDAFFKAWWAQFALTLIGFHWISFVAHEFGFLPWPVAGAILILFASLAHLYIPLAAAAMFFLRNKFRLSVPASLVLLATLHNVGETYWPSVFSWNFGYTLMWIESPIAQWADVVGFLGLSYLLHLINALMTWLWIERNLRISVLSFGLLAFFIAALSLTGSQRRTQWENPESHIHALIVQANIGNFEKYEASLGQGFHREILDRFFSLTKKGLAEHPETELIVWPESSLAEFLDDHNRFRFFTHYFFDQLTPLNRSLAAGAFSSDPPGGRLPREDYNSMFIFNSEAKLSGPPYHKTNLLMFGEYVPFGQLFPILRKWNPGGEGFGRGSGPVITPWQSWKVGPQICYESLEPGFSAALARQGADFLINITNDSWFGPRSEPQEHLYMTLARAIEVRRPLIRSTNTGISTAIEASGFIHQQSPIGQEWTGGFDVKLQKDAPLTFYAQACAFLPLVLFLVIGIILGRAVIGTSRLE